MSEKANKVSFKGTIEFHVEAKESLLAPGDFVIVKRGIPRYIILLCPCGCGDELVINLDERLGGAWRLYKKKRRWTLYPSYWRDTHCHSHFIIWNNKIYWFSRDYLSNRSLVVNAEVENKVLKALKENEFTHYLELADECGLIPWECLQACKQLSEKGKCIPKKDDHQEYFRKVGSDKMDI